MPSSPWTRTTERLGNIQLYSASRILGQTLLTLQQTVVGGFFRKVQPQRVIKSLFAAGLPIAKAVTWLTSWEGSPPTASRSSISHRIDCLPHLGSKCSWTSGKYVKFRDPFYMHIYTSLEDKKARMGDQSSSLISTKMSWFWTSTLFESNISRSFDESESRRLLLANTQDLSGEGKREKIFVDSPKYVPEMARRLRQVFILIVFVQGQLIVHYLSGHWLVLHVSSFYSVHFTWMKNTTVWSIW